MAPRQQDYDIVIKSLTYLPAAVDAGAPNEGAAAGAVVLAAPNERPPNKPPLPAFGVAAAVDAALPNSEPPPVDSFTATPTNAIYDIIYKWGTKTVH